MAETQVTEYQREVVLTHRQWKDAVAAQNVELAATLDTRCRQLRNLIVTAKNAARVTRPVE